MVRIKSSLVVDDYSGEEGGQAYVRIRGGSQAWQQCVGGLSAARVDHRRISARALPEMPGVRDSVTVTGLSIRTLALLTRSRGA
jgi:hypothetical protein